MCSAPARAREAGGASRTEAENTPLEPGHCSTRSPDSHPDTARTHRRGNASRCTPNGPPCIPSSLRRGLNMSAVPEEFVRRTDALAEEAITALRQLPQGLRAQAAAPISACPCARSPSRDTPAMFGAEKNPPFHVYDTSGPYTDPDAHIDLLKGLPPLRARWIEERGDSEVLAAAHLRVHAPPGGGPEARAHAFRALSGRCAGRKPAPT